VLHGFHGLRDHPGFLGPLHLNQPLKSRPFTPMMVVEHEAFTFLYLVFSNPNEFLYGEKHRKDNCKASLNLKIIALISI